VVAFAVTNVDHIIVLSVLFARRDLRFHSLSHRGRCDSAGVLSALLRPGLAVA
jgi:cadmium resistance protein CadD (predicted permease)